MTWQWLVLLGCGLVFAVDDETVSLALENSEFGFDMYKRIAEEDDAENIFFSPYSISAAMAMVHLGSRGQTKNEIADVFGFEEDVDANFKKLIDELFNTDVADALVILKSANKFYGQKDFEFLKSFTDDLAEYYGAEGETVDFNKQAEAARQTINQWVERQTEDSIQELFAQGTIDSSTLLVLVNALYFKANWKIQFDKADTISDATFTQRDGGTSTVSMMHLTDNFKYIRVDDQQLSVLELPYHGDTTAMYIVLPDQGVDIAEVEEDLTAADLSDLIEDMQSTDVIVSLPKFEVTQKMELNPLLEALGVEKVFTSAADLSGINGNPGLYITDVVHQAYIKIDEEGTEASAATGVVVNFKSARNMVFTVDRPFLFVIQDMVTGSNLFMGRVVNPTTTTRPLALRMMRRSAGLPSDEVKDGGSSAMTIAATVAMVMLVTLAAFGFKHI